MNVITQRCPHNPKTSLLILKINSSFENHYEVCDQCASEDAELADKIVPLSEIKMSAAEISLTADEIDTYDANQRSMLP